MTGRWTAPILLALMLLGGATDTAAQVQVSARLESDRTTVGESVRFSVVVSGADREIVPPTLPDIDGVDVFGAGQSQRFSFVDGRSTAEYSWSWSIVPRREGTVRIPAIDVEVDGTTYQTSARELHVAAAGAPGGPSARSDTPGLDSPDAFVTMKVDRDTAVVGEQVILTFAFYRATRTSMFESPEYSPPRTEGFWREDLPPERHRREVVRSRRYEVTEIQYALFPTRAGDLEISEATVRLPDDAFGSFFRRTRPRRGPEVLRTEPIQVHVRPLPRPQPDDFSGTVAAGLTLLSAVDRREVEQGDAITWRIRLEGIGHVDAAALPEPRLPDGLALHESSSASDSGPDGGRLRGSRTVEYLIIPQEAGEFVVPGLEYSWFDSSRQEYRRARTEAIPIKVLPSERATPSLFAGGRKSEIELLARDILHIRQVGPDTSAWPGPLAQRPVFWAVISGAPLLWAGSLLVARRRQALLADPRRMRARRARAKALRELRGDRPVDQRVASAVEGYVADRFDRSASGLVRDEIERLLASAGVSAEIVRRTRVLLENCDAVRFAPSGAAADRLEEDARSLIDALEGEFDG